MKQEERKRKQRIERRSLLPHWRDVRCVYDLSHLAGVVCGRTSECVRYMITSSSRSIDLLKQIQRKGNVTEGEEKEKRTTTRSTTQQVHINDTFVQGCSQCDEERLRMILRDRTSGAVRGTNI